LSEYIFMSASEREEFKEIVARNIFGELALDPDWDDAPLTENQRVDEDDDPSQAYCYQLAEMLLRMGGVRSYA